LSQRDRLLNRKRPSVPYQLLIDDDSDARMELEEAEAALDLARMGPQDDDEVKAEVDEAAERVEKAKAALEACYETITIRAVEPKRFEEIIDAHPKRDAENEPYNIDAVSRELFLEGVESELTREEWEQEMLSARMSFGESESGNGVFAAALLVNSRIPKAIIPKG
jgi:hypothetical protein